MKILSDSAVSKTDLDTIKANAAWMKIKYDRKLNQLQLLIGVLFIADAALALGLKFFP